MYPANIAKRKEEKRKIRRIRKRGRKGHDNDANLLVHQQV